MIYCICKPKIILRRGMMKKRIVSVGLAVVAAATLLAAGCGEGKNYIKMSYYDETSYAEGVDYSTINENLFYRNERKVDVADPCVAYVDDENDADYGKYYLYGTTGNTGFFCWKSGDLVNWEGVGYALLYRDLTTPEGKAVSVDSWAPEVIYDGDAGKWYMFFSSTPKDSSNSYIPYIAESDSPAGPFTLIDSIGSYKATDGTPLKDIENIETNNSYYYQRYMTFDPYQMSQAMAKLGLADMDATSDVLRAIDFHPYVDSATGDKYLYFNTSVNSYIMGIKMNSWTEPDYSTLTIIAKPGYSTPSAGEKDVPNEMNTSVNEAAWITEYGGKYYLTYSTNSYKDKTYQVCQAVADSPLGEFRKLTEAEGGILLSADAALRDDVSGTGHSSIINAAGQYYIVYHKHNSVSEGGSSRHIAVDEIEWITVKDAQGNDLDVMYANGPTTSVQPLPEFASEYKNVASEAEVSAALRPCRRAPERFPPESSVHHRTARAAFEAGRPALPDLRKPPRARRRFCRRRNRAAPPTAPRRAGAGGFRSGVRGFRMDRAAPRACGRIRVLRIRLRAEAGRYRSGGIRVPESGARGRAAPRTA